MRHLETDRLTLRQWELNDFNAYAEMVAEPDVMRYLSSSGTPMSRFAAWRSFSNNVGHWSLRGFGMFAVVERSSEHLVGRIGPWHPEGWPGFEIGWTLNRAHWGQGYATEAVKACISHAFTELGRSHIISLIDPENTRSIRVAQRVGERLEGRVELPDFPDHPVLKYGLTKEAWLVQL